MVQIAVSGGGIAGMAAALAAARSGHEVTLFSGSRPASFAGGLQLAPNGWAALRDLGLEDEAVRQSIRLTEITVRSLGTMGFPRPQTMRTTGFVWRMRMALAAAAEAM